MCAFGGNHTINLIGTYYSRLPCKDYKHKTIKCTQNLFDIKHKLGILYMVNNGV